MASTRVDIQATSIMANHTMTVRLTGVTEFRVRVWIAEQLMRLAARVLRTGIEVEIG
jgi:hypothetical protein